MIISFHNVTPAPLAGVTDFRTDVWEKQYVFEPGSKYNVVAPSGKGKTTFMHLIYGLRDDYTGEVKIDQQDVKSMKATQLTNLRRDHISMVYQDLRLFLRLTAWENLQVKMALYKDSSADKFRKMAERLSVTHVLDNPCMTLSYGERQRISIIRALIQPFQWLLLDEPFSHLDKENTDKAADLIREEVLARNAGIIITSLGTNDSFTYDSKLHL